MLDFLTKHFQFILFAGVIALVGSYIPEIAYVLTPLLFFLFMRSKMEQSMFMFLYILLILSDNLAFSFASKIKPVIMVLFSLYVIRDPNMLSKNPILGSFGVFLVYTLFLLPLSPNMIQSIQKNISYILLFLSIPGFVINLLKEYGSKSILTLIRLCGFVLIIGLVLKIVFPQSVISHENRFTGLFGNPNGLAIFCFFTFALLKVFREHLNFDKLQKKQEYWFLIVVIIAALLMSKSRTSLLAIIIFIFFNQFRSIPKAVSFLAVILMVTMYDYLLNSAIGVIMDLGLGAEFRIEGTESIEKASGRIVAWEHAWEEIQKSPIFGRGWNYDEIWIFGPIQAKLNLLNHQGGVHNTFLILWLNTGIIGLVMFISALLYNFFKASAKSDLALPLLYGSLVLATFEPWLSSSLNPYTIIFLICLSIMLKHDVVKIEET